MAVKGVALARNYKISKYNYVTKAQRLEEDGKARDIRYKALSPKDKALWRLLVEYGMSLMDSVAKGYAMDELPYVERISKLMEAENEV